MGKVQYIDGRKVYEKEFTRLIDEEYKGNTIIFWQDRNYNSVTGFVLKEPRPKTSTDKTEAELRSHYGYGSDDNDNMAFYYRAKTKEEVLKYIKHSIDVSQMGKLTQTNAIQVLNKVIEKVGYDVGGYSHTFNPKPVKLKKGGVKYEAFVPTTDNEGEDLYYELEELGFHNTFFDAPYYWRMAHEKSRVRVEYVEGDFYLYLRK